MGALTTSVTTSAGLVTIQVDCDSAAGYQSPYAPMPAPGCRNPGASSRDALFLGTPLSSSENKLVKTGAAYTDFVRFRVYAAAAAIAPNVGQTRMVLGYTDYLVQLNGTLPSAGYQYFFCPLDAAGTAALQPALRNAILGINNYYKVVRDCPSSPGIGAGTTRALTYFPSRSDIPSRGPLSSPVIFSRPASGVGTYWDNGTMWVEPLLMVAPKYTVAEGMPNNALWYVSRATVAAGAGVPTLTVGLTWLDSAGNAISSTTLGTFPLTFVTTNGVNDFYGGAGDLDLTVPAMPSTARYYQLTNTPSVAIPTTILISFTTTDNLFVGLRTESGVTLSGDPYTQQVLTNNLMATPFCSFDGSLYRPGLLFAL